MGEKREGGDKGVEESQGVRENEAIGDAPKASALSTRPIVRHYLPLAGKSHTRDGYFATTTAGRQAGVVDCV